MNKMPSPTSEYWRVTRVIATKDILDAIRNKTILLVLIGVGLVMLTSQALPLILELQDTQRLAVIDPGLPSLVEQLASSDKFDLVVLPSQAALEVFLGESSGTWLGLVLPGSLPAAPVRLDGYFGHTVNPEDARAAVAFFETELTGVLGTPVAIQAEGHTIYPAVDANGRPFMVAMTLTIIIFLTSAYLVPYLMVEEKENRTMDVLLASPASIGQVVIGKAIAGMVYGFASALVVMVFNRVMLVHWGWAVLAVLCGTLFATAIGLLIGSVFDNSQNMSLWLGGLLAVLMVPILLDKLVSASWSGFLKAVVSWMPSTQLARLLQASFSEQVPLAVALPAAGILLGGAGVVLVVVAGVVRRMDR